MECNKDEAEKCIAMARGKLQDAERLLHKAERLYPTAQAKKLLELLKSFDQAQSEQEAEPMKWRSDEKMSSKREGNIKKEKKETMTDKEEIKREEKESKREKEPSHEFEVNIKHIQAVLRVRNCNEFHEMLGVSKDATESEVRTAFKKLALQLHPDKNKCPGAIDAFKAVQIAYNSMLRDAEKRNGGTI